jgi:hypothetical protein
MDCWVLSGYEQITRSLDLESTSFLSNMSTIMYLMALQVSEVYLLSCI